MDKAAKETERIHAELLRELRRLYNSADRQIQEEIEEYLDAIILDDEEATQRQRVKYAEKNGIRNIVGIFTAVMLLTNEKAIGWINSAMNNIAGINYEHVRAKVERVTGVNIGGTAEAYSGTRYSKRAYRRATQSKFVFDTAMKQIRTGLKRGENSKEISRRIRKAGNVSRNSSNNTAVTETTRIRSESRLDAMRESAKRGIQMVKIWRHSFHVKAPRDWHMDMDGEQKPLDEPFIADGVEMQHPGDPNGGAENNCFCHCYLDEEVVSW